LADGYQGNRHHRGGCDRPGAKGSAKESRPGCARQVSACLRTEGRKTSMDVQTLQQIANQRRADAVTMIARAGTGHTGGAMSCLDALTCLFYHVMNESDHFLLSKGHSVEGYWAILA